MLVTALRSYREAPARRGEQKADNKARGGGCGNTDLVVRSWCAQQCARGGTDYSAGSTGRRQGDPGQADRCRLWDSADLSGDLFRANVADGTELGHKVKDILDHGDLVPDALVNDMVAERLSHPDVNRGFILDGYPRTVGQAEWLDGYLKNRQASDGGAAPFSAIAPLVIQIVVGYNQLLQRITGRRSCPTCGRIYNLYFQPPKVEGICDFDGGRLVVRPDDKEEVVSERLKAYQGQTLPLVSYYKAKGQLVDVDGDQTVEAVAAQASRAIENADRL